jgi:hypothetical protein
MMLRLATLDKNANRSIIDEVETMIYYTLDKHVNRTIRDEGETMIFCTLDKHANHGFNLVYDVTISVLV